MNFASQYEDVQFAHSHSQQHNDKLELKDKFNMVLFRQFDDGNKILNSNDVHTVEQMKEFLEQYRYPIVQEFD